MNVSLHEKPLMHPVRHYMGAGVVISFFKLRSSNESSTI